MTMTEEDRQAIVACADLVGRSGARNFQIGYLHDDVPAELAGWYAHASYKGARISEENHPGPTQAAEALAVRLLTGGKCRCGKLVALGRDGAMAYDASMADGSRWSVAEAAEAGQCLWERRGEKWWPGCPEPAGRRAVRRG
jgi:hypothetical protein